MQIVTSPYNFTGDQYCNHSKVKTSAKVSSQILASEHQPSIYGFVKFCM